MLFPAQGCSSVYGTYQCRVHSLPHPGHRLGRLGHPLVKVATLDAVRGALAAQDGVVAAQGAVRRPLAVLDLGARAGAPVDAVSGARGLQRLELGPPQPGLARGLQASPGLASHSPAMDRAWSGAPRLPKMLPLKGGLRKVAAAGPASSTRALSRKTATSVRSCMVLRSGDGRRRRETSARQVFWIVLWRHQRHLLNGWYSCYHGKQRAQAQSFKTSPTITPQLFRESLNREVGRAWTKFVTMI
ncbi:Catalase-peroxidase [Frankliniella fusca]|uniref:Catalase-peroxidase n=1 Tax=Frankliniella fusca TaxID=407009 RepID=A0AAE1L771_9NEOP|nr:Catalase-peroxidase [Frankliniella fusca]